MEWYEALVGGVLALNIFAVAALSLRTAAQALQFCKDPARAGRFPRALRRLCAALFASDALLGVVSNMAAQGHWIEYIVDSPESDLEDWHVNGPATAAVIAFRVLPLLSLGCAAAAFWLARGKAPSKRRKFAAYVLAAAALLLWAAAIAFWVLALCAGNI